MHELRSLTRGVLHRARTVLLLLVAVVGVIAGLLGMHVLGGGSHPAHEAPAPHTVSHVTAEEAQPASGHCGEAGCDELGLMAVGCVLALLALSLLLPATRSWRNAEVRPSALFLPMLHGRPAPTPSLIALSISRT